jgi:hypothetical protein
MSLGLIFAISAAAQSQLLVVKRDRTASLINDFDFHLFFCSYLC